MIFGVRFRFYPVARNHHRSPALHKILLHGGVLVAHAVGMTVAVLARREGRIFIVFAVYLAGQRLRIHVRAVVLRHPRIPHIAPVFQRIARVDEGIYVVLGPRDVYFRVLVLDRVAKGDEFRRRAGHFPLVRAEQRIHTGLVDDEGVRIAAYGQGVIVAGIGLAVAAVLHRGQDRRGDQLLDRLCPLFLVRLRFALVNVVQRFQGAVRVLAEGTDIQTVEHIDVRRGRF